MNLKQEQLGGLDCQIVDLLPEGQSPEMIVIFCHGYGAPGTDLVGLGPEILQLKPQLKNSAQFYFPAAPLSLDAMGAYGGRAWWHLDVEKFMASVDGGLARDLRNEKPEGLENSHQLLVKMIQEIQDRTNLPMSRFVLGGFSQGSMLATDVSLRSDDKPAGLMVFSGTLLCESEWGPLIGQLSETRILQSHGRQDPVLPYDNAVLLHEHFEKNGIKNEFISFDGIHTIPMEALTRSAEILEEISQSFED
jgi:phospholipase/carboxylesterase